MDQVLYNKPKFFSIYNKLLEEDGDIFKIYIFFRLLFIGYFSKVTKKYCNIQQLFLNSKFKFGEISEKLTANDYKHLRFYYNLWRSCTEFPAKEISPQTINEKYGEIMSVRFSSWLNLVWEEKRAWFFFDCWFIVRKKISERDFEVNWIILIEKI